MALGPQLPNLDRVDRWIVWDLETEQQLELLSPTASENIQSAKATTSFNHKIATDVFIADYTTHSFCHLSSASSEFSLDLHPTKGTLSVSRKVFWINSKHGSYLFIQKRLQLSMGLYRLRSLGQTFQQSNILVNPPSTSYTTPMFLIRHDGNS